MWKKKGLWGVIHWTRLAVGTYFQKYPPAGKPLDPSLRVYLFISESQSSSPRHLTLSHRFCLVTRSHNQFKSILKQIGWRRMGAGVKLPSPCDVIHREAPLLPSGREPGHFWRKWFVQGQCFPAWIQGKRWFEDLNVKCEPQRWFC